MNENLITEIFIDVDDFYTSFGQELNKKTLDFNNAYRDKKGQLSMSEIMTIEIMFHYSRFRTFKDYYLRFVLLEGKKYFPKTVSYNRFVELSQRIVFPLAMYLITRRFGDSTGIAFIDSTKIIVGNVKREKQLKVFKNIAAKSKDSVGWFYGFKLHIVINHIGELIGVCLSPANTDDRSIAIIDKITHFLTGLLFGDKGYISSGLTTYLFEKGIRLVTKIKKNMKNILMSPVEKLLLRKRAVIESVNDYLKNVFYIEHTRHRSHNNFFSNLFSGLIAYTFAPKKPSISLDFLPEIIPN